MVDFYLSKNVHCCEIGNVTVFLDLHTRKYHAIETRLLPPIRGWGGGIANGKGVTPPTVALANDMIELGLLTSSVAEGKEFSPVSITAEPVAKLHPEVSPTIHFGHVLNFLACLLYVGINLKLGRLQPLLRRLTSHSDASPSVETIDTDRIMETFLRLRPWVYTAREHCLLDSLVLTAFLRRYSQPSQCVIAVSLKPFNAHAWVQQGPTVLNDTVSHVRLYTPLLII